MDRNMDFFMVDLQEDNQEVEIEGISKFKYPTGHEKEGQPVPWILKPITTKQLEVITDNNTTRKRKKGRETKTIDNKRVTLEMMVESIVYPDFKNEAWLKKEELLDPVDLLEKVLSLPGDFQRISNEVLDVSGIGDDTEEETVEEAKN